MPELPEVQTTVNGLNATVRGKKIVDVWTDYKSTHKMHRGSVKEAKFYKEFCQKVTGQKIIKAERRAKNILIHLSGGHTILVHMKMTGHFVYDRPEYPHVRFSLKLDNGKTLALSDMRRFAKITVIDTKNLDTSLHLGNIGPEPLETSFTYPKFKERLLTKPKGKIKTVLMDPSVVAGIGNIYSDEILWRACVHPVSTVNKIPEKNLKLMFTAMKETLNKGIDFGGDSMSDYRNIKGERGDFQNHHEAYRRTNQKCSRDKGIIKRLVVGSRSAHFCPVHQKLFQ
ncbi:DNA-formamidopyrimidine glycosylase [Candidatus Parcubacteria bacterium]|nr:DNA-formamidopyrimidine glycosylase [Candidatus Parcubacteria bacterium]